MTVYEREDNRLTRIVRAESALQIPGSWQLKDVRIYDADMNFARRLPTLDALAGVTPDRFNLAMRFTKADEATSKKTGYQGPVILCNINYTPISGHFTTSEVTNYLKNSDRILIWYAPLAAEGYFIPYRMLLTTSMGDLSMVLTRLRQ